MSIQNLVRPDFSGVVSVAVDGQAVFRGEYGFADKANEIPNRVDTRFGTASAGKVFVAAAILGLIEKGARFQYNNTGYVVLGLIIEEMTGKSFDVYLKEAIFDPAGMADTGYYELDRLPARSRRRPMSRKCMREFKGKHYERRESDRPVRDELPVVCRFSSEGAGHQ